MCNSPGSLPTIEFIAGETQTLTYNVYSGSISNPCTLSKAVFSITPCTNKFGNPPISKAMTVSKNEITVVLNSEDTINLSGKYLYQIAIKDTSGTIEIPKHGVLYIENNIDKSGTSGL